MEDEGAEGHWLALIAGDEIDPGMIVEARLDERDLVVWRSELGTACVMDARCPHQFSHLAAEGQVAGEEIICCSHWWRFALDGTGSYEDARGHREERAAIGILPCREHEGTVWIRVSPR